MYNVNMDYRDKIKNSRITKIEESDFGLYVWKLPDGKILGDTDGNVLNVPSERHDLRKMKIIRDAATHYGYPEGEAVFMASTRRVTDDEYEEQKDRLKNGLIADPYDAPALLDELAAEKQHGSR